jgi:uncharacterized phage-associated protein
MQTLPVLNHVLWIAYRDKYDADLTPVKVQKLLYFLHGWYLAVTGTLLLTEPFVRGKYGPILLSLERDLQVYAGGPVDDYIPEMDTTSGELKPFFVDVKALPQFQEVLERVWKQYGRLSPVQLSSLAHAPGSPWAQTTPGEPISNDLLHVHFVGQGALNSALATR